MIPNERSATSSALELRGKDARVESDDVPSKAQTLDDIREAYLFAKNGGEGQPVDEMHREIAEELAREELEENADIRL